MRPKKEQRRAHMNKTRDDLVLSTNHKRKANLLYISCESKYKIEIKSLET